MNFVGRQEQDFCYPFSHKFMSRDLVFFTKILLQSSSFFGFLNSNTHNFWSIKETRPDQFLQVFVISGRFSSLFEFIVVCFCDFYLDLTELCVSWKHVYWRRCSWGWLTQSPPMVWLEAAMPLVWLGSAALVEAWVGWWSCTSGIFVLELRRRFRGLGWLVGWWVIGGFL
jgi:hypothetical protein